MFFSSSFRKENVECSAAWQRQSRRAIDLGCFSLTGKMRELVVSAGENVEVTLPRNGVELNAFVVPTPPDGKSKTAAWFYLCRWKKDVLSLCLTVSTYLSCFG